MDTDVILVTLVDYTYGDRGIVSLYYVVSDIAIFVLKRDVKLQLANSLYYIYASSFPAMAWGKLREMLVIVTSVS